MQGMAITSAARSLNQSPCHVHGMAVIRRLNHTSSSSIKLLDGIGLFAKQRYLLEYW